MVKAERNRQWWIIVESLTNWERDAARNFDHYGIPKKRIGAARKMRAGDILLVYVSRPAKAIADVRQVTADDMKHLPTGGDYDLPCPVAIATKSVFALAQEDWISISEIISGTSIARGNSNWGGALRQTILPIPEKDGLFILKKIIEAAGELNSTSALRRLIDISTSDD